MKDQTQERLAKISAIATLVLHALETPAGRRDIQALSGALKAINDHAEMSVGAARGSESTKPSRRGAAATFMEVFGTSMALMAKHANNAEFVAQRIADAEKYHAHCLDQEAEEKAAFVARMKAAKEAKAAKPERQPVSH